MSDWLAQLREEAADHLRQTGRPLVTLSYAQSLDGSITLRAGCQTAISGPESKVLTHRIRAAHDAILVGIGTILADDPRLSARLAEGPDPQPVVLDSHLRLPLNARLLANPCPPIVATTDQADQASQRVLEAAGAYVARLPADSNGRVSLAALLDLLSGEGLSSLMVEGGAAVITSFLRERLANRLILTIAPVIAGGYRAVQDLCAPTWEAMPRLVNTTCERAGDDWIVWGEFA
jgi:GTP cyclohydrolase II